MTQPIPSSARQAELPFSSPGRRVLLTGARGFVGSEVRRQLLERGWEVVAISRNLRADDACPGVIQVAADIAGEGWQRWCEGCSAAIHLVGIIREAPRAGATFERAHVRATEGVIEACRALGIRRILPHVGARRPGARPRPRTTARSGRPRRRSAAPGSTGRSSGRR